MINQIKKIEVFGNTEDFTESFHVLEIGENLFRMAENSVLNHALTLGTEFETRTNEVGQFEIIRITKFSDFSTKRFILNSQFNESEYQLLGDEIVRQGGFWQVDFGSIAIVNLPKDSTLDLEEIFHIFEFNPIEFKD